MSTEKPRGSDLSPVRPRPTLADRVKARVAQAERSINEQAREANLKNKRGRPPKAAPLTNSALAERDVQSLRKVYREMRMLYRGYRRQTGTPAVAELRSAVDAFKKGESLTSLVQIASFLDDRKLLAW